MVDVPFNKNKKTIKITLNKARFPGHSIPSTWRCPAWKLPSLADPCTALGSLGDSLRGAIKIGTYIT
jgi:hypothetical protein